MSAPPPPAVDAVSAAITLASAFVGPALAQVLGTYAVIVAAGLCGALLSLRRRDAGSRAGAALHVCVWTLISALITVPLAEIASTRAHVPALWLFAPIAVVISGIGDEWPGAVNWALAALARLRGKENPDAR